MPSNSPPELGLYLVQLWFTQNGLPWNPRIEDNLISIGVSFVEQLKLLEPSEFVGLFEGGTIIMKRQAAMIHKNMLMGEDFDPTKCTIEYVASCVAIKDRQYPSVKTNGSLKLAAEQNNSQSIKQGPAHHKQKKKRGLTDEGTSNQLTSCCSNAMKSGDCVEGIDSHLDDIGSHCGQMKSHIFNDFLASNLDLSPSIVKVFRSMFLHGCRRPSQPGKGLVVTADSVYGSKLRVSVSRPHTYVRQNYGSDCSNKTNNPNTLHRFTYGTGSGILTHGICKDHLVFHDYGSDLKKIGDRIRDFAREKMGNDPNLVVKDLVTAVAIAYYKGKKTFKHRDNQYKKDGSLNSRLNSQTYHTATYILTIGDPRCLDFELRREKQKDEKGHGPFLVEGGNISFQLEHGSLFVLHPMDETPMIRRHFGSDHICSFYHGCDGLVMDKEGMSLGLVFRNVDHYTEVRKDTGQVFGLGQRTGNVPSEEDKVLDDFFTNVEQMEKIETQLQNLWIFLESKYFLQAK